MKLYRFLLIATATLGFTFFSTSCGPGAIVLTSTVAGHVLGGLIGAGTGAIIGNQSGDAAKGGAGTGALNGDKKDKENAQQ